MPRTAPGRQSPHSADRTRDISVGVYKLRLGRVDAAKMLAEIGPEKLRQRAACYDALTRAYLTVLTIIEPSQPPKTARKPKG